MPHKIKKIFDEKLTFENLYQAHLRAKNHKSGRKDILSFEIHLENNLINLYRQLKNGSYHLGDYTTFTVFEPKQREIKSLPYRDRIVHQFYVEEFIKPYIMKRFISTTYACIPFRGTHKAAKKVQEYMQQIRHLLGDFWILKCDIKKFFYSIDKAILFKIMEKYIQDAKLLQFTKQIIYEKQTDPIGIPIGNYTSQFFANIYLNELDQFAKHKLKLKYYVRYMDDFIILLPTKQDCIAMKKQIEEFVQLSLHLELNYKSNYYPCHFGADFCGYRIFPSHILLRNNSKKKMKRKIQQYNQLYYKNALNIPKALSSIVSWKGHASHANTYTLQKKLLNKCEFLFTNIVYEKNQDYLEQLISKENR